MGAVAVYAASLRALNIGLCANVTAASLSLLSARGLEVLGLDGLAPGVVNAQVLRAALRSSAKSLRYVSLAGSLRTLDAAGVSEVLAFLAQAAPRLQVLDLSATAPRTLSVEILISVAFAMRELRRLVVTGAGLTPTELDAVRAVRETLTLVQADATTAPSQRMFAYRQPTPPVKKPQTGRR
jgi:Ran GTPase-activating protein (RanGAP) involved in mRNA processing and transport